MYLSARVYEEQFVGYGKDRVSWNYELAARGAKCTGMYILNYNTYIIYVCMYIYIYIYIYIYTRYIYGYGKDRVSWNYELAARGAKFKGATPDANINMIPPERHLHRNKETKP